MKRYCVIVDGFYMCKTVQNIHHNSTKIKVYWMVEVPDRPRTYQYEYVEYLHGDYRCIITHCKMKKVNKAKCLHTGEV